MSKFLGVDTGTSFTRIYSRKKGIVFNQPSLAALKADTENLDVIAAGIDVGIVMGKTPGTAVPMSPIVRGLPLEFEIAVKMLSEFFKSTFKSLNAGHPDILTAIPDKFTENDRLSIEDMLLESGAHKVLAINKTFAAALGSEIDVTSAQGGMIVDIGGGTTEIASFDFSGIDTSETLTLAGMDFTEAIIAYVKSSKNILLSSEAAEQLKTVSGSAVKGLNLVSGLPVSISLKPIELIKVAAPLIDNIGNKIIDILNGTSSNIIDKIYEDGILLTGGGSLLMGIDRYLEKMIGIKINRADSPELSVIKGIGTVINNERKYGGLYI